ncbi:MAG: growth inhibitor PemK [Alphaproteobacteria bacterium]|nr:growth inhibitor PemK [Alphaproteobacteria bacterium]MCW5743954.1 growth inhibitor PemK [Alphaproteobacteria bacterium]
MSLPVPKPGLVIRYSFLWSDEHAEGAREGAKDRPCAIVVAVRRDAHGDIRTIVAPITHLRPRDPATSIAIAPATCRSLGLDEGRHWLRLDELNSFAWPGYDLRPIPGRRERYDYGMLPPRLFERLRAGILARQKLRATRVLRRDLE